MPHFGPISRRDLVANLKRLGFAGPYPGRRHEFMVRGDATPIIPNPHGSDIGIGLLSRVLKQAGVSREEWEEL